METPEENPLFDNPERPLVMVEWVDSHSNGEGWVPLGSFDPENCVCQSVGWVVSDCEQSISVMPHVCYDSEECQGVMTIPRVAIVSITDLAPAEEPVYGRAANR